MTSQESRRLDIRTASALLGAALLAALALRGLPWRDGLVPPPTPLAHSPTAFLAPGYALLRDAASVVPAGASAVVLTEPRDARLESHLYRLGLALLPGRDVRPAALVDAFVPASIWDGAEYRLVIGKRTEIAEGKLVLETPAGTVWRMRAAR